MQIENTKKKSYGFHSFRQSGVPMYAVKQRVNLGLNNIKFSHHGFCPKKTYSKLRLDLLVSNTGLLLKRAQNIQNLGGFLIISLFP